MSWEDRKLVLIYYARYCSLDGTDGPICDPSVFNRKWYPHTPNSSGLSYEVGILIGAGKIVWLSGRFPCGECSGLQSFIWALKRQLSPKEKVICDAGYTKESFSSLNKISFKSVHRKICAKHEAVNELLKQFAIGRIPFRHCVSKHFRHLRPRFEKGTCSVSKLTIWGKCLQIQLGQPTLSMFELNLFHWYKLVLA